MWREELHRRDVYGRFTAFGGLRGGWDPTSGHASSHLPRAAHKGMIRLGDDPLADERATSFPGHGPAFGGLWHRPGEMFPGGIPALRTDMGAGLGEEESRRLLGRPSGGVSASRSLRSEGRYFREEVRAGRHRRRAATSGRQEYEPESPEVVAAMRLAGTNPVGRRRTARKRRDRQQTVTWIQRLSDRMEGR
jgi:hypothetical protein